MSKEKKEKTAYQLHKEALLKSGRDRRHFDLSIAALDLLAETSDALHVPQVSLLELMIRRYCAPNTEGKPSEF